MSFREYIARQRVTNTPVGDFISDAQFDKDFPEVKTLKELQSYLDLRNACCEAHEAAKIVWRTYCLSLKTKKTGQCLVRT